MQKTLFIASIAVMLVMAHSAKDEAAARKLIQAKTGSMGPASSSKVAGVTTNNDPRRIMTGGSLLYVEKRPPVIILRRKMTPAVG